VFDVGNNRYRLIGRLNYRAGIVYVLKVMDHKEYDKKRWVDDCGCRRPPPKRVRTKGERGSIAFPLEPIGASFSRAEARARKKQEVIRVGKSLPCPFAGVTWASIIETVAPEGVYPGKIGSSTSMTAPTATSASARSRAAAPLTTPATGPTTPPGRCSALPNWRGWSRGC
jgi:hypothetical protein